MNKTTLSKSLQAHRPVTQPQKTRGLHLGLEHSNRTWKQRDNTFTEQPWRGKTPTAGGGVATPLGSIAPPVLRLHLEGTTVERKADLGYDGGELRGW
ncbi:hypothetical protein A2U01_0035121, partial [Trifolium medium]|nr:hypothetical protein [Trifolium medium]